MQQIYKQRQNIRINNDSPDNIVVLIKLELSILPTNNQLSIVHDENSHDANNDETEDHVHELADWTPDELEDNEPEKTLDACANETAFLGHVAFCEACVAGEHDEHAECSGDGLKNGFHLVENKENADQISVRNCVSA